MIMYNPVFQIEYGMDIAISHPECDEQCKHQENWKIVVHLRSAQQINGVDCGVFTLAGLECQEHGVSVLESYPKASSVLNGKYDNREMEGGRYHVSWTNQTDAPTNEDVI